MRCSGGAPQSAPQAGDGLRQTDPPSLTITRGSERPSEQPAANALLAIAAKAKTAPTELREPPGYIATTRS
jgi:hypothetical protein